MLYSTTVYRVIAKLIQEQNMSDVLWTAAS